VPAIKIGHRLVPEESARILPPRPGIDFESDEPEIMVGQIGFDLWPRPSLSWIPDQPGCAGVVRFKKPVQ
jgi:hypothetical protein